MEKNKKNKNPETIHQNFSDLPHDMVLLISSKLSSSFSDILSVKQVCSSWRIAMKNSTKTTYSMLVSLGETKENQKNVVFSLLCMNDQRRYEIKKSPRLVNQYKRPYKSRKLSWFPDYYIVGSHPDGWIILWHKIRKYCLLHLLRNIQIQLPNMVTHGTKLVQLPKHIIKKAVISTCDPTRREDFIMVMSTLISCGDIKNSKLALWRYGDRSWTCFGGNFVVLDVVFCKNTIYAIRSDRGHTSLELWDMNNKLCLPEKKLDIQLFGTHSCLEHLVVSSEYEIFLWNIYNNGIIYKLDLGKERWISEDSLDGRTLFSCYGDSVILSAIDVQRLGFKANSIYFARKEENDIKLKIYDFDNSQCDHPEFQHWPQDMQPFGLFLVST